VPTVDRLVYTIRWPRLLKGGSAVLRCARRVMLIPRFMIRYYREFLQWSSRRPGGGYEATNEDDRHSG